LVFWLLKWVGNNSVEDMTALVHAKREHFRMMHDQHGVLKLVVKASGL
jgi:hypothetical protein